MTSPDPMDAPAPAVEDKRHRCVFVGNL